MAAIIGWAHSKFGKLEDSDLEGLMANAARDAVADAGIGFEDVDAIFDAAIAALERRYGAKLFDRVISVKSPYLTLRVTVRPRTKS